MKKYDEILLGDSATVTHTITDADIDKFVDLTGDDNKLHVNKEFAQKTEFKKPVVHGMLGASFISTLIGTKLPGDGALWFSQTLEFLRPVRIGDTITVIASVIGKNDKSNTIELKTDIINQNKQIVTTGISKVKVIAIQEDPLQSNALPDKILQKSILIIGASGGVGQAVSEKLAKEGYEVILHYKSNKNNIDKLIKNISSTNQKIKTFQADLLIQSEVIELGIKIKRQFPNLIGFVNCSTISLPNIKFENLDWEDIQNHIDINIKSSFFLLKELMTIFINQKYGKIVFLGSQATDAPNSEWLHYIVSKSALTGFVKSLAIEFANKGINVNMVSPSLIDTDLVADIPQRAKLLIEAKTPLKRLCTPNDVAEAVSFLVSDKSNFITGETIRVNGGQVML